MMDPLVRQLKKSIPTLVVYCMLVTFVLLPRSLWCSYLQSNFLKLNVGNCEGIVFSNDRSVAFVEFSVDGKLVPVGDSGKCCDYWRRGDLLSSGAVQENIKKARIISLCFAALVSTRGF